MSDETAKAPEAKAPKAAPAKAKAPEAKGPTVEATGPQTLLIVGKPGEARSVAYDLRDHGSELKLADGGIARGPITGTSEQDGETEGTLEVRIQLSSSIERADA